jgi:hypothetical protein
MTTPNANTNSPEPPKPKTINVWKYRVVIALLIFIIFLLLSVSLYGIWYFWDKGERKSEEITRLESQVSSLQNGLDLDTEELRVNVENQRLKIEDLIAENQRLSQELTSAKATIERLTPKNIKDVKYKELIKINESAGEVWLNPIYVDVNGDGFEDGIFAYRQAGAGGFLNVYVYSYLSTTTLNELLKAEGYQKGTVAYIADGNYLEIKSEAGTPDAPQLATSKFKFDLASRKMIRIP